MDTLELTHCLEVDTAGQVCGALAEIIDRYVLESTDGPLEHVRTLCPHRHILTCLVESFEQELVPPAPVLPTVAQG